MKPQLTSRGYAAKVILFGEYVVLNGADALAMPLPQFGGTWQYAKENILSLQRDLGDFARYLDSNAQANMNTQYFREELAKGLFFDANIPNGYGVGSSGALCAAVYDAFAKEKETSLGQLKSIFAWMEGFFHGSSSGFDPLISYLNQGVKLSQGEVLPVVIPNDKSGLFLLNSGVEREAENYISIFVEKKKQEGFQGVLSQKIAPVTTTAITSFLTGNTRTLFHQFHDISVLQYLHFKEMISHNVLKYWELGMSSNFFKLKICGAGGGGFFLGISENREKTQEILKDFNIIYL